MIRALDYTVVIDGKSFMVKIIIRLQIDGVKMLVPSINSDFTLRQVLDYSQSKKFDIFLELRFDFELVTCK